MFEKKRKKVFLLKEVHCVVVPLTGQVPAIGLLSADQPLDFASHHEDVVKFSWGDVTEWIFLQINIYTYDLIFFYFI